MARIIEVRFPRPPGRSTAPPLRVIESASAGTYGFPGPVREPLDRAYEARREMDREVDLSGEPW